MMVDCNDRKTMNQVSEYSRNVRELVLAQYMAIISMGKVI